MDDRSSHDYKEYYKVLDNIGHGAFGIVKKGIEIKTQKLRAIKVIQLDKLKESIFSYGDENEDPERQLKECIEGFKKECKNMEICTNINSVKFYEYFYNKNNFVIIMELCDMNLLQLLLKKNKEGFNEKEIP